MTIFHTSTSLIRWPKSITETTSAEVLQVEVADYITELNSLLESEVIGFAEMVFKTKTKHIKKKISGEKCIEGARLLRLAHLKGLEKPL